MNRYIPTLAALTLTFCIAGCGTPVQQQAQLNNAITIAMNAMPCYAAVKAATSQNNSAANVLNGSTVVVTYPACANIDGASASLIASAINANAPVVSGATSAVAAK